MKLNGKQLFEMVKNGGKPVVEFDKEAENFDYESFDPGMRARLTSMWEDDECLGCEFDFTEYEEFNKNVEQPAWYGLNGEMVKWSESTYYPKNKRVKIYIGEDYYPGFKIVDESVVFKEYKLSGSNLTYVQWLEEQYLKNK